MSRCPSCDYPLPPDSERTGARCPNCRDPLYDPPARHSRPAREGEGACAVHEGRESVGTCGRCGNYLCVVCRTPWRDHILCAACVQRALESREAAPEQARAHARQSVLAVCLGGGAWLLSALMLVIVAGLSTAGGGKPPAGGEVFLVILAVLVCLADLFPATLGLGQAVAALRTRGSHMILATIGLILSGLYLGAFIGLFTLSLLQN
jgi:hypothetical protein